MQDKYGRKISYLRVSVTDRCNLRCRYCMPEEGVKLLSHDDILSLEEIRDIVRTAVEMGITKVRLTGGEPLVRKGITDLVAMLASIKGITDLALTTNGILLSDYAGKLARAGLNRVNVSIDTMDPWRFRKITRGGDIEKVKKGIKAAQNAGLSPIKLNCVIGKFSTDADAESVKVFGAENGFQVRTIRLMDFAAGKFSVVEGGSGGDCPHCTRLRLTSDGRIRPCLFSDKTYSIRTLGPKEAIQQAVKNKPEFGGPCDHNWMHGIGG